MRKSDISSSKIQHDWGKKGVPLFVSANLRNLYFRKNLSSCKAGSEEEDVSWTTTESASSPQLDINNDDSGEDDHNRAPGRKSDEELLTSMELQIVVPRDKWNQFLTHAAEKSETDEIKPSKGENDLVVLLSFTPSCPKVSFHPTWDHLDDLFLHSNPTIQCEHISFQQHLYPHLELHIYEQKNKLFWMSIPLHPHRLCPFYSSHKTNSYSKGSAQSYSQQYKKDEDSEDEDSRTTSTTSAFSFTKKLPPSLPPNSILITYSNQDICIPSSLHSNLTDNKMISTPATPYFEDDIFDVLSSANTQTSDIDDNNKNSTQTSTPLSARKYNNNETVHDDHLFDLLTPDSPEKKGKTINLIDKSQNSNLNGQKKKCMLSNIEDQCRDLRLILEREEKSLQSDEAILQSDTEELKKLIKQVQKLSKEHFDIKQEVTNQSEKCQGNQSLLEARRMKLLRELQQIYPIAATNSNPNNTSHSKKVYSTRVTSSNNSDMVYTIRGLVLPLHVHSTTSDDEEISAALGYVTHLVFMIGKYLDIPLRYMLVCHPSRSHILSDIGFTYYGNMLPLYKDRDVDKLQLDRGIALLERNIDCLLHMRGIVDQNIGQQPKHMLAKLIQIYRQYN